MKPVHDQLTHGHWFTSSLPLFASSILPLKSFCRELQSTTFQPPQNQFYGQDINHFVGQYHLLCRQELVNRELQTH
jgi:hypothetical protein